MGKTYYFVNMEEFNIPENGFFTDQQLTFGNSRVDPDPISSLEIVEENYYKGWTRLRGIHEMIDKTPRRMAGEDEYLPQTIVGGDLAFNCFYNSNDKIMILNTSKKVALDFQRKLINKNPRDFKPIQKEVDFKRLISMLSDNQIVNSWFNNIDGQVKSVGLFGERVNLDDTFQRFNNLGNLSAITVEWSFVDFDYPINIMITKNCGIVIHANWDIKRDLDFLFDMKNIIFSSEEVPVEL
ncbi:hypothetical protein ACNOIU_10670 [Exiguobacterium mexicanum]|uniref:Uncharacterized protein n=1 Tax=Exiguobacterium mexicanum TaxID=340146 RepID=A0ABT7MKX6_9BACL|nr:MULTISPECIES: hypothetical protein [Exiguobacterium]MDL5375618.1 hypothetical protein [Exiguobacterium mexicanum]